MLMAFRDLVEHARTMPMSASVLVNRDEALGIVADLMATVPEEIRQARWLLKDREEFLAQTRREADDILESARVQAERMVERTEIAREARRAAQRIVDEADSLARRLRLESEDYVDQKLAAFEVVLNRTMQAVNKGRDRLRVAVDEAAGEPEDEEDALGGFFDQDGT
jgi:F0F1-type ATP synthase membrane subunit b/b'